MNGRFAGDEDRVHLAGHVQPFGRLQRFQRNIRIHRRDLRRQQAEPAQAFCRDDGDHFQLGNAGDQVVLAAERAVGRQLRGFAQVQRHLVADLGPQFRGQRSVEDDLLIARRFCSGDSRVAQLPEFAATGDDRHVTGSPPASIAGQLDRAAGEQDRRDRCGIVVGELGLGSQFLRQLLAEEAIDHQQLVDPTQAVEHQMPQRPPDRIADEQGAGQHGRRRRHPQCHGQVHQPVKTEAWRDNAKGGHAPIIGHNACSAT